MTAPAARKGGTILIVLALANLVAYAVRNELFASYADLRAKFHVDDDAIGLLTTIFMLPHAAATLPFGWAGERYDRRRVIALGLMIASVAGALGGLASAWWQLQLTRALVGLGVAAVVPVANSIIGQLYDGDTKASRIAIFNLGLFLGGVVGFGVGTAIGFPAVVVVLGLPGIVVSLVLLVLPVPPPRGHDGHASAGGFWSTISRRFVDDSRALLRIRTLRWLMAGTTSMAFAAGGLLAWFVEFLLRDKGMTKSQSSTLLAISLVGGLAGVVTGGRVADFLHARTRAGRIWTIVIGMSCTVPAAAACIVLPTGIGLDVASILTLFFISWYHAPMAATVDDLAPAGKTVAAQGLVIFTMHMIGTSPSSWVLGIVSRSASLYAAMWVPVAMIVVAAACIAMATRSFVTDQQAARGGSDAPASL
jgi:MFS family permease